MLDETIVIEKKESVEYAPLPDDMYHVEFLDVTSEKRPTYDTRLLPPEEQEIETVLNFQFTLLDGEEDGKSLRGRNLWQNFVPSFLYISKKSGKNKLYQIVEAIQGEPLTPKQEAEGISGKDINALIGKQCRVVTKNQTKGDKTYTHIDNFLPVKVKLASLTDEEKETAKVKPKTSTTESSNEIGPDGIPF